MDEPDFDNEMDPSNISLNFFTDTGYNPISINTEQEESSNSTPIASVVPSEPSLASPFPEDERRVNKKGLFTGYVTGKSMEVAKRKNLIDKIERARENGILNTCIPQLAELSMTQFSMFLRRIFKSEPGLTDFVSDEVLKSLFEDFESGAGSVMEDNAENSEEELTNGEVFYEAGEETESEMERSSDEENNESNQHELPISDSMQPAFYRTRRGIIQADRCIALQMRKLMERRDKFKANLGKMESFLFEEPKTSGDSEEDSQTCLRCRPLIKRAHRRIVKHSFPSNRKETSGTAKLTDDLEKQCSYEYNDVRIRNISTLQRLNNDAVIEDYLHNMGNLPLYIPVKSHAAYNNTGDREKEYYGFVECIKDELPNFPEVLQSLQAAGKKRKAVDHIEVENEAEPKGTGLLLRVKMSKRLLQEDF
ncbi:unnamed protein product [Bursaphelenchus okinawaensis]|uniref:Uncharacterized protein n=1 Tax=Bursaphelenchus okinawaensis TaxID=465554 RepID=A0A811LQD4_9BILA|nr:unnamed protein product [Bursaphelenchus okinawaensis]CAG9125690.1 unnamed protein product [Bursaphelenchus okinawaensis]